MGKRYSIKVIVVTTLLSFSGMSLGVNRDEDLMKQANQILGPLPKAMVSEKNPVTPKKVKLGEKKLEQAIWIMSKVQWGRDLSTMQTGDIVWFLESLTGVIPEEVLTVPLLPSTE